MIVRNHLPWKQLLHFFRTQLLVFFAFDVTISVLYTWAGLTWLALPDLPIAQIGSALTIFLAFRTNSAYDRWWEARMLWGSLVNLSRAFARQILTFLPAAQQDGAEAAEIAAFQREAIYHQVAFVHALRCHLRRQDPFADLEGILAPDTVAQLRQAKNVPAMLLLQMGRLAQHALSKGWVDSIRFAQLDRTLTDLVNVQGGCERIKNTPLPRQYDYLPRIFLQFYCLLLPLGLVAGLKLLTPFASTLIAFMLLALDNVGRGIEDPFENTANDTPMTALSRTIEIDLRQHLGEQQLPPPIQPVEGFLF